MTYFNKQWTEEIQLPDGRVACCKQDVDKYLNENKLVAAGDYSEAIRRNVKYNREKAIRKVMFAEFINNYKRRIWNETNDRKITGK